MSLFPDPASVGLAVSTAITISTIVCNAIQESADLENQLVSVERILQYTEVRPEVSRGRITMEGWPFKGGIQIKEARVSYILGKDVLHGITCTIHPGEKAKCF